MENAAITDKPPLLITALDNYDWISTCLKQGQIIHLKWSLSPERLAAVDSEGRSLKHLIQDAMIKKYPVDCWREDGSHYTVSLTPIEAMLRSDLSRAGPKTAYSAHLEQWGTVLDEDLLKFLLRIGIHPNLPVGANGETFFELFVKINLAYLNPKPLKLFIEAQGDFYKKDVKGECILDWVNQSTARFIIRTYNQLPDKERNSAIKIQQWWRIKKHNRREIDRDPVSLAAHPYLALPVREPSAHPIDAKKLQEWVDLHADDKDKKIAQKVASSIQHISYPHFLFGLKQAIKKFNEFLALLPKEQRNYLIIVDDFRKDKSNLWVTKLAEKYLAYPPEAIVSSGGLDTYKPSPKTQHMVYFDDASYSGTMMVGIIKSIMDIYKKEYDLIKQLQLHVVIPFVTAKAHQLLLNAAHPTNEVIIHFQETMPAFDVPETHFNSATATYLDHKVPVSVSTISVIDDGKLLNKVGATKRFLKFVETISSPYKNPVSLKTDLEAFVEGLPSATLKKEFKKCHNQNNLDTFIICYARHEDTLSPQINEKMRDLLPQLDLKPEYRTAKLQHLLSLYERYLISVIMREDNPLKIEIFSGKLSIIKALQQSLTVGKTADKQLNSFINSYIEVYDRLQHVILPKRDIKVCGLNFFSERLSNEAADKKLNAAINNILPELILSASYQKKLH